ncbi:MAG: peptide chain release factor N(5)-glutamine methyltransferase [Actinomycetota bacterium]|nr:peptide chain release factor N(5)-glutamine methyltransferase [Actinomycetota bacterium]
MSPAEVVRRAAGYLDRHGVESPAPTAELLLQSVLGTDRAGLYARREGLSAAEAKLFGRALCRRCVGTPTQHITGEQGFRRLILSVRAGVFVPRPETEVVVEVALGALDRVAEPVVVDVCTGTGAIALALKDECPAARVLASDLSPDAVALARENAHRLGLDVDVRLGDLLDPFPLELRGSIDLVVANPPYVALEDAATLPADVRADPPLALFGDVPLYGRSFAQAALWLRPGGVVVVEIGDMMGAEVTAAAEDAGFLDVRTLPDLAGRDRVVTGQRP